MSLKTEFQDMAVELINSSDAFLSVSQTVILSQPIYQTTDTETGDVYTSWDDYTCQGIVGPWINQMAAASRSNDIQTEDLSCLVQFKNFPFNLRVGNDKMTLADGTEYLVVYKETDPAEATINLRLTKLLD